MYGEKFNLELDEKILEINSPKDSCGGPYVVVYKDLDDRWAIVALDWNESPALGIRWFWGTNGNPVSRKVYAIWFILPETLSNIILDGLSLDMDFKNRVKRFLSGEITGEELQKGQ